SLVELDAAVDLAAPEVPADPQERSRLDDALNSLSEEYRAVLMLVVIEGYTYSEVRRARIWPSKVSGAGVFKPATRL
ncbi:RNA polymerase sigma factor, partial [Rhizobium johnstonii]|uniref:RNA polymerase sigma factor n=1 Tax=Rhizobium johnstonii TaxID=3019933 RepID=UPI003F99E01D